MPKPRYFPTPSLIQIYRNRKDSEIVEILKNNELLVSQEYSDRLKSTDVRPSTSVFFDRVQFEKMLENSFPDTLGKFKMTKIKDSNKLVVSGMGSTWNMIEVLEAISAYLQTAGFIIASRTVKGWFRKSITLEIVERVIPFTKIQGFTPVYQRVDNLYYEHTCVFCCRSAMLKVMPIRVPSISGHFDLFAYDGSDYFVPRG